MGLALVVYKYIKKCLLEKHSKRHNCKTNTGLFIQLICRLYELGQIFFGDMIIAHFSGEITVVGAHIHESVSREVEEDGLSLSGLLALEGFVDSCGYRVT